MSFTPASKALARFKVLDLTRVRAGPTAARQFADWGADVIKIELPRGLDESDMGGPRHGPDFQNLHRNKRSLTLNLKESGSITRAFVRSTSASSMVLFPVSARTDPIASVRDSIKSPRAWAG
jgi:crotonobetainyl-CoA:carnitine CoA-transferase CaiB-like acyl-CoA transferase